MSPVDQERLFRDVNGCVRIYGEAESLFRDGDCQVVSALEVTAERIHDPYGMKQVFAVGSSSDRLTGAQIDTRPYW